MTSFSYPMAAKMAIDTVLHHKLRSFLTVLGVIIGTSTIIGVGSIITGMDSAIANIFNSFGTDTMVVFKFKTGIRFDLSREEMRRKPLSYENARAIAERCPSVKHASPYLFPSLYRGIHRARHQGNDIFNIDIGGTERGYMENGEEMLFGRFFTEVESLHRRPVVVIGEDVYKALFANVDPIGKWVDVDGQQAEVIGVLKRSPAALPGSDDRRVLFPYFTMRKLFPNAKENMIIVIAEKGQLARAKDEVTAVLRLERRVPHNQPDNFAISTADQMVEEFRGLMATTAIVMVVLSSIGLLVGGIGVMNIMLVSVTERTREIGVRKAVGARHRDIIAQFLTEAVVLTGLGGLLGIGLGWLISLGVGRAYSSLPTTVPLWAVAAGVVVSVGVGLFFGIWPASKAAQLDPVAALRHE